MRGWRLGPRLQALQASQQFAPQWEQLTDECKTVGVAIEQVRSSPALRSTLNRVLALGNYLNGTSARGGAYGFKLSALDKLSALKTTDNSSNLLAFLVETLKKPSTGSAPMAARRSVNSGALLSPMQSSKRSTRSGANPKDTRSF